MKFTKTEVAKILPGARRIVWDDDLRGFGIRVTEGSTSYLVDFRANGTRRRKVIGSTKIITLDEARMRAREILAAATLTGDDITRAAPRPDASMTFHEVWRQMIDTIDSKANAPRTVTDYEYRYDRWIKPHLGNKPIDKITRADVKQAQLGTTGTRSQNFTVVLIKKTFNYAIKVAELLPANHRNPADGIKMQKMESTRRALDEDDIAKFGNALADMEREGKVSPWMANLFRLSLICGLRPGEVKSLKWARVNLPKRRMVVEGKTGAREVILTMEAIEVLEATPKVQGCEYVFAGRRYGKPLVSVHKVLGQVTARAGIERFRPYDFRHTAATGALAAGSDVRSVQALLGHTDLQTTSGYLHTNRARRQEAAEAAARFSKAVVRRVS